MANTLKFGNGNWAIKEDSTLAYSDQYDNFKPLPFDFTRASNATRVNKLGLIETVSTGQPRIDFLGNTNGALLLEPQRTNILTYSESFSGWLLDDATIVGNNTISPNGTQNAVLLKGNTNSSRHHIGKGYSQQNANTSFSVFVKAKELKYVQIASANDVNQYANFDVSIGVIGTVGSTFSNAKIEAIGSDGWYRLSAVATRSNGLYISLVSGLTATWLESWTMSNNTDGLYIWGAQSEQGSYATSYIPTQGSAATRVAESCNQTTPSGVIGQTEGVVFVEIDYTPHSVNYECVVILQGTTTAEFLECYFSSTNKLNFYITNGGSQQMSFASAVQTKGIKKIAIAYKSNDFAIYLNGTQIYTDNSGSVALLSKIGLGVYSGNAYVLSQPIKQFQLYNTRLSNSELATLTTI